MEKIAPMGGGGGRGHHLFFDNYFSPGTGCTVCQEDEGRRHAFLSRQQHGCYPLEG